MSLKRIPLTLCSISVFMLAVAVVVTPDLQASVMHPDQMGDTVWFRDIEESTSTPNDPEPIYGEPTVSGNNLSFTPNRTGSFVAQSTNGEGVDLTDGSLSIILEAKSGHYLTGIDFSESGLVSLFSQNGDPFAAVNALLDISIDEVDGSPMNINLPGELLSFTPSDGDFQHSVDATGPNFASAWSGSAFVDLDAALANVPGGGVTRATLLVNNQLLASTLELGSSAFIDKKDVDINITTRVIPEPSLIALALMAGVGCIATYRRPAIR